MQDVVLLIAFACEKRLPGLEALTLQRQNLTVPAAGCLISLPSTKKVKGTNKTRSAIFNNGILVSIISSLLCVIAPHSVLLFHLVSSICFSFRARTETLCGAERVEPSAGYARRIPDRTLAAVLPRRHGSGGTTGSHSQSRSGHPVVKNGQRPMTRRSINSLVFPMASARRLSQSMGCVRNQCLPSFEAQQIWRLHLGNQVLPVHKDRLGVERARGSSCL